MKELVRIQDFHTTPLTSEEMINIKGGENEWWRWYKYDHQPSVDCNGTMQSTEIQYNWFGFHATGEAGPDGSF